MATANYETEFLQERATLGTSRVDKLAHVIRGVKILGAESKNGRTYTEAAMSGAVSLYEGCAVFLNHPKGSPGSPRGYEERVGTLRNVRMQSGSLIGDLHYNPKHSVGAQLEHDAEFSPSSVGLSHNCQARTSRGYGGKVVVEEITRVVSVDLVTNPATTNGLFESITGGGDTFCTRQELRGMLGIRDIDIDALVHAGCPVAKLGMAEIFSLTAVRAALAKMTGSPASSEQRESVEVEENANAQFLSLLKYGIPDSRPACITEWRDGIGFDGFEPLGDGKRRRWN